MRNSLIGFNKMGDSNDDMEALSGLAEEYMERKSMTTNDEVEDEIDDFMDAPTGDPPGAVDMDLSVTINIGNYENIKFNLGINEPYTGRKGDTRNDKVEEIFKYIEEKLAEKVVTLHEDLKPLVSALGGKK